VPPYRRVALALVVLLAEFLGVLSLSELFGAGDVVGELDALVDDVGVVVAGRPGVENVGVVVAGDPALEESAAVAAVVLLDGFGVVEEVARRTRLRVGPVRERRFFILLLVGGAAAAGEARKLAKAHATPPRAICSTAAPF